MLNEYYAERGWDSKTGIPKAEKLRKLNLAYIIEDLKENGIKMK